MKIYYLLIVSENNNNNKDKDKDKEKEKKKKKPYTTIGKTSSGRKALERVKPSDAEAQQEILTNPAIKQFADKELTLNEVKVRMYSPDWEFDIEDG